MFMNHNYNIHLFEITVVIKTIKIFNHEIFQEIRFPISAKLCGIFFQVCAEFIIIINYYYYLYYYYFLFI